MTHEPECPMSSGAILTCLCDTIRTCEARALDAARDAVAAARDANTAPDGRAITSWGVGWDESMTAALAAIDALRVTK